MNNSHITMFLLAFCFLLSSCDSAKKERHNLIHKAEDLQTEAISKYKVLEKDLKNYSSKSDSSKIAQFKAFNQRLSDWKKNMDLVKSDDDNHDHGAHDHDHDHSHGGGKMQLTEKDRVVVIEEFLDSLKNIHSDLNKLIAK